MLTVLIVDDHALVRHGLCQLLSQHPEISVIGEASNGLEAIKLAREQQPNVILLDLNLPDITGLEVTKRLKRLNKVKIAIVSACSHDLISSRALQAGAQGYVLKEDNPEDLLEAILTVGNGGSYLSPTIIQKLALKTHLNKTNTVFDALTNHELELVLMFVRGTKVKTISELLSLSPKTISTYRQKIYQKLGVKTDVEMTFLALKYGLLEAVEK